MRPDRRLVAGVLMIAALALVIGLVQESGSAVWESRMVLLGIFVILTVSLNLVSGFTGLFSLGHIGFMALGVYISAILTLSLEKKASLLPKLPGWLEGFSLSQMVGPIPLGWLLATLIAGVLVALIALAVGAVIMRLSGNFVAVATLGFLVIVRVILINADSFTRGSRTFSGVTPFTDMWWAWGWAVITIYVAWRIKRSPWGRQMLAQRADKWAAQSVGIPILRPRLLAFVVSAFFGAVAGSLYAHFIPAFSPSVFYFDITFEVITMLVVGGLGSVTGSVLGAIVIVALSEGLREVEDRSQLYGISGLTLGVFFLAIIIFRPDGIMGQRELSLDGLRRRLPRRSDVGEGWTTPPVDDSTLPDDPNAPDDPV
jgi:branched-chain amino acid transport system permease protein